VLAADAIVVAVGTERRQSKYFLEHIVRPSQLPSSAGRSMDPIFAIQAKDRECFVSRMDAVAAKRSASMLRKTMIVLAKVGAALLCTLEQGLVSR
jgi:hypothetical protein